MNRKFKHELKKAYRIPEPVRKDEFLRGLEKKQNGCSSSLRISSVRRYAAIALAAAAFLGVYVSNNNIFKLNRDFSADKPPTITEEYSENKSGEAVSSVSATESISETVPAAEHSASEEINTSEYSGAVTENLAPDEIITNTDAASEELKTEPISSDTHVQTQTAAVTDIKTESAVTQTTAAPVPTDAPVTSTEQPDLGRDYTVTPLVQYSVTKKIREYEDNEDVVNGGQSTGTQLDGIVRWTDIAEASEIVVSGTVQAVFYTSVNGRPWTQTDIVINDVWYGDLKPGDRISIYSPGGYMPLSEFIEHNGKESLFSDMTQEEISQTTLHDHGGNAADPKTGESSLYFLKAGTGSIPGGAYQYSFITDVCRFRQEGELYISAAFDMCSFTEDELREYLD